MRILMLFFASYAFAQVKLSSSLTRVYHAGAATGLGAVGFTLFSDDFADVDPEHPIYCRLVFEYGVTLSETRVDASLTGRLSNPIYLPLSLSLFLDEPTGLQVIAPRDSVAIVRWVSGESDIWIRVQRSSSTWLQREDGTQLAPNSSYPVTFDIGVREYLYGLDPENGNMIYPTRNSEISDATTAVSTQICANLKGLGFTPNVDIYMSAYAFTAEAEVAPGRFEAQNPLPDFYEVPVVSLGSTVDWSITGHLQAESAAFQPAGELIQGEARASLQLLGVDRRFPIEADSGFWGEGSYLDLWLAPELEAGFSTTSPGFELDGQAAGALAFDQDQAFVLEGKTLYRHIRLNWDGAPLDLFQLFELNARVKLEWRPALQPEQIRLSYRLEQASNPAEDVPATGLPDQQVCAPEFYTLEQGDWRPFTQSPALDFPHLTAANGGFTTRLLLGNSGAEPLTVQLQGFQSSGEPLPLQELTLNRGETRTLDPSQTLGPLASHLRILSDSPIASLRYQSLTPGAIPADLPASAPATRGWRLYPVNQSGAWDGFALVNRAGTPSQVRLLAFNAAGARLEERVLAKLSPDQKLLLVLPLVPNATYFELRAEEPVSLVALRGDSTNQYLWSNPVLPLAE